MIFVPFNPWVIPYAFTHGCWLDVSVELLSAKEEKSRLRSQYRGRQTTPTGDRSAPEDTLDGLEDDGEGYADEKPIGDRTMEGMKDESSSVRSEKKHEHGQKKHHAGTHESDERDMSDTDENFDHHHHSHSHSAHHRHHNHHHSDPGHHGRHDDHEEQTFQQHEKRHHKALGAR